MKEGRPKKLEVRLREAPHKQISLNDPDARSMICWGSGLVGYNVQTAVYMQHQLIVAHDVTNGGLDRRLLAAMRA